MLAKEYLDASEALRKSVSLDKGAWQGFQNSHPQKNPGRGGGYQSSSGQTGAGNKGWQSSGNKARKGLLWKNWTPYFGSPQSKKFGPPGTKMFEIFGPPSKIFYLPLKNLAKHFPRVWRGSKYFPEKKTIPFPITFVWLRISPWMQRALLILNNWSSLLLSYIKTSLSPCMQGSKYFTWNIWSPFPTSYPCALAKF